MFDTDFWFKETEKKFLHNIDSFYFSVKLHNDFSNDSHDPSALHLRDVINNSLVLVGKIEVNRYFPVLMHPNRFYEFNHNPAVKALNIFVFQKGG